MPARIGLCAQSVAATVERKYQSTERSACVQLYGEVNLSQYIIIKAAMIM